MNPHLQALIALLVALCTRQSEAADSCSGRCGNYDENSYNCQCSSLCITNGNCCSDYNIYCDSTATCVGRNCYGDDQSLPCQCNTYCSQYNDCCPDYQEICVGSCAGRCGPGTDSGENCQCNSYCQQYGDCCPDYDELCVGSTSSPSGTTSSGSSSSCNKLSVSNAELESISQQLSGQDWASGYSAGESDVIVNIQGYTTQGSSVDNAPDPFFSYVNEAVLERDNFQRLQALQDNYFRNQGQTEVVTSQELDEEDAFLDGFLNSDVGILLFEFLDSKNLAGCNGLDGFKMLLSDIWFGMYDRQAVDDTSGFEHSFVGEIKGSGVSGFHNWVAFYHQEQSGSINYLGYLSQYPDIRLYGMTFTWYEADKPINGITVGTSPEIEFALYTLCHLTRPNQRCYIVLQDAYANTYDAAIQTYTWSKSYPPGGQSYVASAYFIS